MDLNIENYDTQDIFNILDININDLNNSTTKLDTNFVQQKLNKKIAVLKSLDNEEDNEDNSLTTENKAELIDFFYKCFIKISNVLKDREKNDVINQDNHYIIKHREAEKQEVFESRVKGGIVNPLTIKTYKTIININTRFRDNYNSTSSTDFVINLPYTLKKVLSMKLLNYQLPNTVYTISNKLGSNCFYVNDKQIMICNGSYDSDSIVEEINTRLEGNSVNIKLEYSPVSGRMFFTSTDDISFNLDFNFIKTDDMRYNLSNNINKDQLTLGWLLGFRGNYLDKGIKNEKNINNKYSGKIQYMSESIYDNVGNSYFLLSINDFLNNRQV